MKILVTGASGFVGRALCDHLQTRGHDITAAVRRRGSAPPGTIETFVADIGPQTDWTNALKGQDAVVHLAARVHVMEENEEDPLTAFRAINTAGTLRLAQVAMAAGIRSFVYLSSIKANGEGAAGPYTVEDSPSPVDPYGISKLEAELGLKVLAAESNIHATSIRIPLVYGPEVGGNFRRLVAMANSGLPLPLASVKNRRTMISIWNLVDLIEHQLQPLPPGYELVLAGDTQPSSTADLLRTIAAGLGRPSRLFPFPVCLLEFAGRIARRGDVVQRLTGSLEITTGSTRTTFSWKPPLTSAEGLAATARKLENQDPDRQGDTPSRPRILLGVTIDESLQFLGELPQVLVSEGWDVHIVSTPGVRLDRMSSLPGVSTHGIAMSRDPSLLADIRSLAQWLGVVRAVRPTVSFIGTPKAGLLGMVSSWLLRVPNRIYLLRGLRLETATGLRRSLLAILEKLAIATAHEVLTVSPSLAIRTRELRLARSTPVKVLGPGSSHGVNLSVFNMRDPTEARRRARESLGLSQDEFVVGFVGRIRTDKGIRELISACRINSLDQPTKLVLIGRVEEADILHHASDAIAAGQISHLDHTDQVEALIPAFDLLCLPSHREGFPNVVLEAAALGIPALVSDATGSRDSVVHDVTGRIHEVGNVDSLVANLRSLENASYRAKLGLSAHERVVREFSEDRVNTRYVQYLSSLTDTQHHKLSVFRRSRRRASGAKDSRG